MSDDSSVAEAGNASMDVKNIQLNHNSVGEIRETQSRDETANIRETE